MAEPDQRITPSQVRRHSELADGLLGALAVARALVLAGRVVDLTGLNDRVGSLGAQLMDLPWDQSRLLLPQLYDMVAELDRLASAICEADGMEN